MASLSTNLFLRLHKWAARQDENFLTESLAVVLEQLLMLAPGVGTRLVSQLTGGFIERSVDDASPIEIQTQVEALAGRPDLEISTPHRLVWIEVKAESKLRAGQLEGYRILLGDKKVEHKLLVLLTRYREVFQPEDARPDREIRWFQVADWVEDEIPAAEEASEAAGYLARQFLEFLEGRNMRLTQVGKFMPEGGRALRAFADMLYEAATACKVSVKKSAGWDSIGITLDGQKYSVGVEYAKPEDLWFGTRCKIDPAAAAKLGDGEVTEEAWIPGHYRWEKTVALDSEPVHFFARSKVGQIEWLEDFLQDCLKKARSIETPDQPPIPEEPEGA